jgi:molecular chaperone HscB
MICWSCQREAGSDAFCGKCKAIQPPDPRATAFDVLGVPRRFSIDVAAAEAAYKALAKAVHPDRFARADPQARRAAMQRTVQLNEAWRALRDPIRRAEYLVGLAGVDVGGEEGTVKRDAEGGKTRIPVPQDLLLETLELREALADARAEGDAARVSSLTADVRAKLDEALARAGDKLDTGAPAEDAARELVAARYYRRFLDESSTSSLEAR